MSVIIEEIKTGETEMISSQVAASVMLGINVMEMIPGSTGNGYRVVAIYHAVNPAYRAALVKAGA